MKQIFFILTLGIFLTYSSHAQRGNKDQKVQGYSIGDKAEDFSLKNIDGKLVSLSSVEAEKGYIIIFTSNECPYAVAYEDRIIDLHNNMVKKGYPVVAINSNDESIESGDSFKAMIARSSEKNFPFVYLKDEKGVYAKFGANKTPHVFLLDKDLTVKYIGAIYDSPKDASGVEVKFVENAIASLSTGELPNPSMTKAIGCPIKTKDSVRKGGRKGPPSPNQLLERMDTDKDNKISKSEAKGPLANDFDRLDVNKDGALTLEELSAMKKRK